MGNSYWQAEAHPAVELYGLFLQSAGAATRLEEGSMDIPRSPRVSESVAQVDEHQPVESTAINVER